MGKGAMVNAPEGQTASSIDPHKITTPEGKIEREQTPVAALALAVLRTRASLTFATPCHSRGTSF